MNICNATTGMVVMSEAAMSWPQENTLPQITSSGPEGYQDHQQEEEQPEDGEGPGRGHLSPSRSR